MEGSVGSSASNQNVDMRMLNQLTVWVLDNEERRPTLVRAAVHLLSRMAFKVPLERREIVESQCIELCPQYIANVCEVSPQTARNAWAGIRDMMGWAELSGRKGIRERLTGLGYDVRHVARGGRWGTHIFLTKTIAATVRAFVCWAYQSGKTKTYNVSLPFSALSIVRSTLSNNVPRSNEVNTKKQLSPQTPQTGGRVRHSRDKMTPKRRKCWEMHPLWAVSTRRDRMKIMMDHIDGKWSKRSRIRVANKPIGNPPFGFAAPEVYVEPDDWFGIRIQLFEMRYGG